MKRSGKLFEWPSFQYADTRRRSIEASDGRPTWRQGKIEKRTTSPLQVNDGGLALLCMRYHCLAKKLEPLFGRGAVQNSILHQYGDLSSILHLHY